MCDAFVVVVCYWCLCSFAAAVAVAIVFAVVPLILPLNNNLNGCFLLHAFHARCSNFGGAFFVDGCLLPAVVVVDLIVEGVVEWIAASRFAQAAMAPDGDERTVT